ncbi:MAG: DNA adenine methylase [Pseudomonadota bacterium]
MKAPSRPALRWFGGKWLQAPKIISHFPAHRRYVEPYGGAASVLLQKPRAPGAEVYNDLDDEVVNLFEVLCDDALAAKLERMVDLTPFSRTEFERAYEVSDNPVERARRLLIRSFMGFGADGATGTYRTGFRANSTRAGTTPAHDWGNYPPVIGEIHRRLKRVTIERRPALDVIRKHDGIDTLIYADPPYPHETRQRVRRGSGENADGVYRHEMTDAEHVEMLELLLSVKGMVVLSGYACDLYDDRLKGWERLEYAALADGARPRREVLWINPAAQAAHGLFGAVA